MNNKGFTLIEVLVVSAILFLVVGFLGYLSVKHFWIYNSQVSQLDVGNDARISLDDIDNFVRSARRVSASYDIYSTGSQTLVLQLPSIDSSNKIIENTYDYVVYYLSDQALAREIFPDSISDREAGIKTLTIYIDPENFSFTYDNADYSLVKKITTSISIKKGQSGQQRSITLSSKSFLRNY